MLHHVSWWTFLTKKTCGHPKTGSLDTCTHCQHFGVVLQQIWEHLLSMYLKPQGILQQLEMLPSFQLPMVSLDLSWAVLFCLLTWRNPQCCYFHTNDREEHIAGQETCSVDVHPTHAHLRTVPALAQALVYGPLMAIRGSQDPHYEWHLLA